MLFSFDKKFENMTVYSFKTQTVGIEVGGGKGISIKYQILLMLVLRC